MVSVLIPTYNYNVTQLTELLVNQLETTGLTYEIRVLDDCSSMLHTVETNKNIEKHPRCFFIQNEKNLGRTATRQALAKAAKYNWLLFMDADVLPKNDDFINKFTIEKLTADVVFGGLAYESKTPEKDRMLRWKYGKAREAKTVEEREKMPYLSIISGCILIKKDVFLSANTLNENIYGGDVVFCLELQKMKAVVKHIDNPVLHLGLESNDSFIEKTKKGLESLYYFEKEKIIPEDYRPIQKAYLSLHRNKMKTLFIKSIQLFEKALLKNLNSSNPSLFLFDLYRLYFYTQLQQNKN